MKKSLLAGTAITLVVTLLVVDAGPHIHAGERTAGPAAWGSSLSIPSTGR